MKKGIALLVLCLFCLSMLTGCGFVPSPSPSPGGSENSPSSTLHSAIEDIQSAANDNDFRKAFALLEEAEEEYPGKADLAVVRDELCEDYEAYTRTESLKAADQGNFVKAYNLVTAALERLNSEDLKALQKVFFSRMPVLLNDMDLFKDASQGGDWNVSTIEKNDWYTDTYNNTYTHSISIGTEAVYYLVDFKYQTLRGTVACPKGITSDNARKSATLEIYGDKKLLARFENVNEFFHPNTFELDVSSYEMITFYVECEGLNIWNDWGYYATIFDAELIPIPLELPEH